MTDRAFLMWLHERLEHVHGERPIADYMHKLRAIIKATSRAQLSPNTGTANSLEELKEGLD